MYNRQRASKTICFEAKWKRETYFKRKELWNDFSSRIYCFNEALQRYNFIQKQIFR